MEAFAYMDDVSLGLMGITANTVRAFAVLRLGLLNISHRHCDQPTQWQYRSRPDCGGNPAAGQRRRP